MKSGIIFNFKKKNHPSSAAAEKELLLHLKRALKRTFQKFDQLEETSIPLVAKSLVESLPLSAIMLCDMNPLYLKNLTAEALTSGWGIDSCELKQICAWINAGLLQHVAFPEPEEPVKPLPIPVGLVESNPFHIVSELKSTNSLWRLFIGRTLQKVESPEDYEKRQPGALSAMEKAFSLAMDSIDAPLSFELLIKFHAACVEGVKGLNKEQPLFINEPYRKTQPEGAPFGFGISAAGSNYNKTAAGYREVCLYPGAGTDYEVKSNRINATLYGAALAKRVDAELREYNQQMKMLKDKKEQLSLILHTLGTIERIHPFWDANCRAICVIALQRELLRHGFAPVILNNPNHLDCFSVQELMNELVIGYKNLQEVLYVGKDPKDHKDGESQQMKKLLLPN